MRVFRGGRVGPLVGLQTVPGGAAGALLRPPETRLPGLCGPGWGGGARRSLGAGGNRAALCAVAPIPSRRAWAARAVAAVDPAPSAAGAAAAAWAGVSGPQSGSALPGTDQVVVGAVDLCPSGRRGADQYCVRARPAAGRAVAQGQLRGGQRGGQSLRGATPDRGGDLSAAGPAL